MNKTLAKLSLVMTLVALTTLPANAGGKVDSSCTFNGTPLKGKIQIVSSFPDFKVKIVNSFPDLKVKPVNSFPDNCGEWQFVTSFPDFKVQFVDSFPDFTIQYVNSFPGVN